MTDEIYNAAAAVFVLAAGIMLLAALSKARELYDDYTEWSTLRRRAKYRAPAYRAVAERRTLKNNRQELWRRLSK